MTATTSDQFLRKVGLLVANGSTAFDLSELEISFKVNQGDQETPNSATIRVLNLKDSTAQQIQKEFTRVILQAGYQNGAYGVIFDGTIKQILRGRLTGMDTYLDIFAADGDIATNFGVVNMTLAPGATYQQVAQQYAKAMGADIGYQDYGVGNPQLIRSKVLFGMARDGMRTLARTTQTSWTIQNGKVVIIPLTGYLPGDAVVLNSKTGMIGIPQQTQEGIKVTCLLNPKIQVGTQVQINNADIQRAQPSLDYTAFNYFPSIANDGYYRVLVCEHEGDIRANDPWHSKLTCLTVNKTVAPGKSVKEFG